jgi:antitoxin MazE
LRARRDWLWESDDENQICEIGKPTGAASGLAKKVGACEGGQVDMTVENGALIARVGGSKRRRRYSLEELVEQITDENIHHEIEWGPVGQRSK